MIPTQPSSYETIQSCLQRQKSPQRRQFPCNFPPPSSINLSCPTCPYPNAAPSVNSAITGSSTSFYGCYTPGCNGSVYPCLKTATARLKSTIRQCTKPSPGGPTTAPLRRP